MNKQSKLRFVERKGNVRIFTYVNKGKVYPYNSTKRGWFNKGK